MQLSQPLQRQRGPRPVTTEPLTPQVVAGFDAYARVQVEAVALDRHGRLAGLPAVIERAGMKVKIVTRRNEAPLVAVKGSVSSPAHLGAKAVGQRAAYAWQCSTDQRT